MPDSYQFIQTNGFNNGLARIEAILFRVTNSSFNDEVRRLIQSLDSLRRDPRDSHHWTHRLLVFKNEHGEILREEEILGDLELDDSDIQRLEYVIEAPIYFQARQQNVLFGQLITNYSVNDDDLTIKLISIYIIDSSFNQIV